MSDRHFTNLQILLDPKTEASLLAVLLNGYYPCNDFSSCTYSGIIKDCIIYFVLLLF